MPSGKTACSLPTTAYASRLTSHARSGVSGAVANSTRKRDGRGGGRVAGALVDDVPVLVGPLAHLGVWGAQRAQPRRHVLGRPVGMPQRGPVDHLQPLEHPELPTPDPSSAVVVPDHDSQPAGVAGRPQPVAADQRQASSTNAHHQGNVWDGRPAVGPDHLLAQA